MITKQLGMASSDDVQINPKCSVRQPISVRAGALRGVSLNHLVSGREQRRCDGKAEQPCGLSVDNELELAPYDRLCGLGASENTASIGAI
jgi:hypothetical protein